MRFSTFAIAAAAAGSATAQSNATVCDKYTSAIFGAPNNTAANQYTLVSLLVKTAVIGNFTGNGTQNPSLPGSANAVPGIINPAGGIVKYFDGSLKSTNRQGMPVSVNFLDGQSNTSQLFEQPMFIGSETSNQYKLFAHLVSYFGALLGCSGYGNGTAFPAYAGSNSQYNVHKYMDLSETEHTYFIQQVGLAATSFGVTMDDVTAVAMTLNSTFGYRCAPAAAVIPNTPVAQQVICQGTGCPLAASPEASCSGSAAVAGFTPVAAATAAASDMAAGSTLASATGTGSATGSATGTASTGSATGATTGTGAVASATGAAASGASSAASAATGAAPRQTAAAGILAGVAGVAAMLL